MTAEWEVVICDHSIYLKKYFIIQISLFHTNLIRTKILFHVDFTNKCTEEDKQIFKYKIHETRDAMDSCTQWSCVTDCVGHCMTKKVGYLRKCASCFDSLATCGRAKCERKCFYRRWGEKCINCMKEHCEELFTECSGLPKNLFGEPKDPWEKWWNICLNSRVKSMSLLNINLSSDLCAFDN